MIHIYKGKEADSLIDLRLKHFYSKVTDSKMAIHPLYLPPTSSSAMLYSEFTIKFKNGWETCYTVEEKSPLQ